VKSASFNARWQLTSHRRHRPSGVYRFLTVEEADAWMTRTMARTAREPQVEDLAPVCQALNDADARYILIGGFARRAPPVGTISSSRLVPLPGD